MALAIALLAWVVMRNRVRHVPRHHVEVIERLGYRVREQVRTQAPQWGMEVIDLHVEDIEATEEGGA
jgi:hypothetical protein